MTSGPVGSGRRPERSFDRPTDHLPPVRRPDDRPEPTLLTHRDDDYAMVDEPDDDFDGEPPVDSAGRRRRTWRWVRRAVYICIFLGVTAPIAIFYVTYQNVTVPDPKTVAFGQARPRRRPATRSWGRPAARTAGRAMVVDRKPLPGGWVGLG